MIEVLFSECFVVVLLFCPVFRVFLVSVVVHFVTNKKNENSWMCQTLVVACASHSDLLMA